MELSKEAQAGLGIKPTEPTEEDKAQEAELAKSAEAEEDAFGDELNEEAAEEAADESEKNAAEKEKSEAEDAKEESKESEKTVPLGLHLKTKEELTELKKQVAELNAAKTTTERDSLIKQMAEELEMDVEAATKFVDHMSKIMGKEAKKEDANAEEAEVTADEAARIAEEKAHFETEYDEVSDVLAKEYPNATPQMRKEAKQELFKLAFSEKYALVPGKHEAYALDYVIAKEKKLFDTLLKVSSKDKSTESSRDLSGDAEEEIDFTSPHMSPAKYKLYQERKMNERMKPATNPQKPRFI